MTTMTIEQALEAATKAVEATKDDARPVATRTALRALLDVCKALHEARTSPVAPPTPATDQPPLPMPPSSVSGSEPPAPGAS